MTDVTSREPDLDPDDDEDEDDEKRTPFHRGVGGLVVIAIGLALLMKTFLIQAFFIPSGSMEQTLHGCDGCTGDRVLVNKVVYKFRDIHRGEIVVFNGKDTDFPKEASIAPPANAVQRVLRGVQGLIGFGGASDKDFIKRVIGVEGDVIACCDDGRITVNGQPVEEPYVYLSAGVTEIGAFEPVTVGKDHLFVMGDHRNGSSDSRVHGTIPESAVVGRAFAVFYPVGRQKALPVPEVWDPTKNDTRSGALPAVGPTSISTEALTSPVLGIVLVLPLALARKRRRRTTD